MGEDVPSHLLGNLFLDFLPVWRIDPVMNRGGMKYSMNIAGKYFIQHNLDDYYVQISWNYRMKFSGN
eukprot:5458877-Amphidinium_carterae.1